LGRRRISQVRNFTWGKGQGFLEIFLLTRSAVVEGEIECEEMEIKGEVFLGKSGKIKARNIRVGSLISQGEINTEKITGERVEFKAGAKFIGDIECKILVVEEGAKINGRISQELQAQNKG
jgi:Protein of unknown function, DUF583.